MSFLFISHSKQQTRYFNDPSARYRCIFPAEALINAGESACVIHIDQVTREQVLAADTVLFHRPSFSTRFRTVLDWAEDQNKRCIADYDDLLFSPDDSANSAAVQSGALSESLARQYSQDYLKALNSFDECIVSTQPLADWVTKVSTVKQVHVLPNCLPIRWFAQTDAVPPRERFEKKVLRYLPGTSHHDGDFDFVISILTDFLNNNSEVVLEVIGPLRFDLPEVKAEQVRQVGGVPFDQLAQKMADSWVCIAPLLDTSFNQCKSGLKFWESGLYGVPLVASPIEDFEKFKCDGLIQVRSKEEWIGALESLLDWDTYQQASESAAKSAKRVLHGFEKNPYIDVLRQAQDERGLKDRRALRRAQDEWELQDGSALRACSERTESTFYRLQQQYFSAWFGPGWMAWLLKPRLGITVDQMPSEAVDKALQYEMLQQLWAGTHWACDLLGDPSAEDSSLECVSLEQLPKLPASFTPHIKGFYSSWDAWIEDVARITQILWQQQRAPAGSPFMRKWRKFRRSPKHFLEDSKSPWLRWMARLC